MKNTTITVGGVEVLVVRKRIKNFNLVVQPPDGKVRISVPVRASIAQIISTLQSRLDWINNKRELVASWPKPIEIQMVTGEVHYFFGQPYNLEVVERRGRHEIICNSSTLFLYVNPDTTTANKLRVLRSWYRLQLNSCIPDLVEKWQSIMGVKITSWGVKRMKTRWGTCNITKRRIWLNLELAKKAPECLEYVIVHELTHLLERGHNDRFWKIISKFLPEWRKTKAMLQ